MPTPAPTPAPAFKWRVCVYDEMKQLLRDDDSYKRIPKTSNAAVKHYSNVNVGELMPISVEEYAADTTSLVHDFVTACARFAFNNFSNRHYPGIWPWQKTEIPRPNHGVAHSMRQLMFGIIIQHKLLACNPGAFMSALTIDRACAGRRPQNARAGGAPKRLEEPDLLKRYLALSVAPLFNDMGRSHDHTVRAIPTQEGSYRSLFAPLLGVEEDGGGASSHLLDKLTSGQYALGTVYAHQVVSFTMYRIMMNHLLNVSGEDVDFARFVDYVAAAGLYRLTVAKRNVYSPQSALDRFVLLNELVVGAETLDACRDDSSTMYGTHSAKYYLYVSSLGECGEEGGRKHVQEMEGIVLHAIAATLDFEGGDTTTVECAKEDAMVFRGARSIRNYKNSATRKLLLKSFDNIFYLLFNEFQSGKSARFEIRISTLLNPSLRGLRNRVFRYDMVAGARKVVKLGKGIQYNEAHPRKNAPRGADDAGTERGRSNQRGEKQTAQQRGAAAVESERRQPQQKPQTRQEQRANADRDSHDTQQHARRTEP